MFKTLRGIVARKTSTYLEEKNFLPAKQKGCLTGNKKCKDQLMILKAIYENCRKRITNVFPRLSTRKHLTDRKMNRNFRSEE
jgi:hypothetical protein